MEAATVSLHQQAIMQTVNRAAIAWPRHTARIVSASEILLADGVDQISATAYAVKSSAGGWYRVTAESCECKSFEFDGRGCKHQWAIWLYQIAVQRAAVLAERLARAFSVEDQKRLEFCRWLVEHEILTEAA